MVFRYAQHIYVFIFEYIFAFLLNLSTKHTGKIAWACVSKYVKIFFAASENCISCFVSTASGMVANIRNVLFVTRPCQWFCVDSSLSHGYTALQGTRRHQSSQHCCGILGQFYKAGVSPLRNGVETEIIYQETSKKISSWADSLCLRDDGKGYHTMIVSHPT